MRNWFLAFYREWLKKKCLNKIIKKKKPPEANVELCDFVHLNN